MAWITIKSKWILNKKSGQRSVGSANPERPGCCVGISGKQSCEIILQFLQKCHRYEHLIIIMGLSLYYDQSFKNISVN